jgi:predicted amidophosphoribosyltransferase
VLAVNQGKLDKAPIRRRGIVLFDDVLVTGKRFKRCQRRLREVVAPDVRIIGVFVARRVLPEVTFDPIPDDDL